MGSNNIITFEPGDVITDDMFNQFFVTLVGNLMPRNNLGAVTPFAGNLGSLATPWDTLYVNKIVGGGINNIISGNVLPNNPEVGDRFIKTGENNAARGFYVCFVDGVWSSIFEIGGASQYVRRSDLAGVETDRYASYNNAFVGSNYRSGTICLFTDSNGPPTTNNAIGQPDIADRITNGVIAFGAKLRTDKDPNNAVFAPASVADDYSSGDVLYVSIWNDKSAHVKVTLTSDGTLVGVGDAAYIWATATWDEVNDLPDVVDFGDYMLIAEEAPTDLDIKIPASDVVGSPWLRTDGTNVTEATIDAIQGDNETVMLPDKFRVNVTNVSRYIQFSQSGDLNICKIRIPNTDTTNDKDLKRLLQPRAWCGVGPTFIMALTTNVTRATIGTSITYTFNYDVVDSVKPTDSTLYYVTVIGEDVHRGQLTRTAFREYIKSGDAGKIIQVNSAETDTEFVRIPSYMGSWTSNTSYIEGDIVKNGSNIYIFTVDTTGDLTFPGSKTARLNN